MSASAAQIAANRANALHSTGPRTFDGKATSSRNALSHGAYAADDTILAAIDATTTASTLFGDSPIAPYLDYLIAEYQPVGITEIILTRRLAALALRLDRVTDAVEVLIERDEHHTLREQHRLEHAPAIHTDQLTGWAATLLGDDYGPSAIESTPDPTDDPTDAPSPEFAANLPPAPDPLRTARAFTLASQQVAVLSRHENTIERRFQTTLKELRTTQLIRRRSLPSYPPGGITPEQTLFQAVDNRVLRLLAAHGIDLPTPSPAVDRIEANPADLVHSTPTVAPPYRTNEANEPNPAGATDHRNEADAASLGDQPVEPITPNLTDRQNEPSAVNPVPNQAEAGTPNPSDQRIEPNATSLNSNPSRTTQAVLTRYRNEPSAGSHTTPSPLAPPRQELMAPQPM